MKAAGFHFLGMLVLLGGITAAADDDGPPQSRYVFEVFDLPAAAAQDLVRQDVKGAELHGRVIELLKAKTATLDKLIIGRSRGESNFEQTEEYVYPTEFDPPQLPSVLAIIDPGTKPVQPSKPAAADTARISPFNGGLGIISTTTPTALEMRQLGDRLKISGGDKPTSYALETSRLSSVIHHGDLPVPVFATQKLSGVMPATPGQPAFLGTCSFAHRSGVPNERVEEVTSLAFVTTLRDANPVVVVEKDPFKPAHYLRVTLEVISLDKTVAYPLMLEAMDDAALHKRVSALVTEQKAHRETTLVARVASHQRATVANGDEHLDPVEFDPPQVPTTLILAEPELLQDIRAGRQTGVGAQPEVAGGNPNGGFGLITTVSPTAFNMTPMGESMEVEAMARENIIDVNIAVSIRRKTGVVPYDGLDHAVYGLQKLQTSVRTALDRTILLGTLNRARNSGFSGSAKDDRIWLAFLRVSGK